MVTVGQRRLGRKIRKLENSVEFSTKESKAKVEEKNYIDKVREDGELTQDSPVQNLREIARKKKTAST